MISLLLVIGISFFQNVAKTTVGYSEEDYVALSGLVSADEIDIPAMVDVISTSAFFPKDWDLGNMLVRELPRFQVDREIDWVNLAQKFVEFTKRVESDGNRYAQASTSSAMSFFQFTIGSVPTAVNRLNNYVKRNNIGGLPMWAIMLKSNPKLIFELDEQHQAILALVNIIEQRGSDDSLREFFSGNTEAAKDLYYSFHHTDPDEATRKRAEMIFAQVFAD